MGKQLAGVLLLLALTGAGTAWGDDTAIQGIGGAIQPMEEHPSVVMGKMLVTMDLYSDRAAVDCTFVFQNTGELTTVRMGFPESGHPALGREPVGFTSFATWVDGREVQTSIEGLRVGEDNTHWERWRVKRVRFAADQGRTVRVRYTARLGEVSDGSRFFEYMVGTGGSWNGPIGLARVLLRLHHDPNRERFEVPGQFRPVGGECYEWTQEGFEPDAGSHIRVTYSPWFGELSINGIAQPLGELHAPYPLIEDGVIWVQARDLARWLNAELVAPSHVVFTRGERVVTVWKNSRAMERNGKRLTLPAATRVTEGRLMVPLRPVAEALGAKVEYDAPSRQLRLTGADLRAFEEALGSDAASAAARAMPEAWAPREIGDYDAELAEHLRTRGRAHPGMCAGDFNGDGWRDAAVELRRGGEVGVALLLGGGDGEFTLDWLSGPRALEGSGRGSIRYLQTRPAGLVEYWTEDAWQTGGKTGRLELAQDGLELVAWGKAAVMYYWDAASGQYQRVVTAD